MANDIIINVLAKAQGKEVNQLYSDIKKVEDEAEKGAKVKLNVDDAVTALNGLRSYLQKMNKALGNDETKLANFAQMTEDVNRMSTAVGDLAEKFKLIKFDEKNGSFESIARIKESLEGINASLTEIKGSMGVFGNAEGLTKATAKLAEAKKNLDEANQGGMYKANLDKAQESVEKMVSSYSNLANTKIGKDLAGLIDGTKKFDEVDSSVQKLIKDMMMLKEAGRESKLSEIEIHVPATSQLKSLGKNASELFNLLESSGKLFKDGEFNVSTKVSEGINDEAGKIREAAQKYVTAVEEYDEAKQKLDAAEQRANSVAKVAFDSKSIDALSEAMSGIKLALGDGKGDVTFGIDKQALQDITNKIGEVTTAVGQMKESFSQGLTIKGVSATGEELDQMEQQMQEQIQRLMKYQSDVSVEIQKINASFKGLDNMNTLVINIETLADSLDTLYNSMKNIEGVGNTAGREAGRFVENLKDSGLADMAGTAIKAEDLQTITTAIGNVQKAIDGIFKVGEGKELSVFQTQLTGVFNTSAIETWKNDFIKAIGEMVAAAKQLNPNQIIGTGSNRSSTKPSTKPTQQSKQQTASPTLASTPKKQYIDVLSVKKTNGEAVPRVLPENISNSVKEINDAISEVPKVDENNLDGAVKSFNKVAESLLKINEVTGEDISDVVTPMADIASVIDSLHTNVADARNEGVDYKSDEFAEAYNYFDEENDRLRDFDASTFDETVMIIAENVEMAKQKAVDFINRISETMSTEVPVVEEYTSNLTFMQDNESISRYKNASNISNIISSLENTDLSESLDIDPGVTKEQLLSKLEESGIILSESFHRMVDEYYEKLEESNQRIKEASVDSLFAGFMSAGEDEANLDSSNNRASAEEIKAQEQEKIEEVKSKLLNNLKRIYSDTIDQFIISIGSENNGLSPLQDTSIGDDVIFDAQSKIAKSVNVDEFLSDLISRRVNKLSSALSEKTLVPELERGKDDGFLGNMGEKLETINNALSGFEEMKGIDGIGDISQVSEKVKIARQSIKLLVEAVDAFATNQGVEGYDFSKASGGKSYEEMANATKESLSVARESLTSFIQTAQKETQEVTKVSEEAKATTTATFSTPSQATKATTTPSPATQAPTVPEQKPIIDQKDIENAEQLSSILSSISTMFAGKENISADMFGGEGGFKPVLQTLQEIASAIKMVARSFQQLRGESKAFAPLEQYLGNITVQAELAADEVRNLNEAIEDEQIPSQESTPIVAQQVEQQEQAQERVAQAEGEVVAEKEHEKAANNEIIEQFNTMIRLLGLINSLKGKMYAKGTEQSSGIGFNDIDLLKQQLGSSNIELPSDIEKSLIRGIININGRDKNGELVKGTLPVLHGTSAMNKAVKLGRPLDTALDQIMDKDEANHTTTFRDVLIKDIFKLGKKQGLEPNLDEVRDLVSQSFLNYIKKYSTDLSSALKNIETIRDSGEFDDSPFIKNILDSAHESLQKRIQKMSEKTKSSIENVNEDGSSKQEVSTTVEEVVSHAGQVIRERISQIDKGLESWGDGGNETAIRNGKTVVGKKEGIILQENLAKRKAILDEQGIGRKIYNRKTGEYSFSNLTASEMTDYYDYLKWVEQAIKSNQSKAPVNGKPLDRFTKTMAKSLMGKEYGISTEDFKGEGNFEAFQQKLKLVETYMTAFKQKYDEVKANFKDGIIPDEVFSNIERFAQASLKLEETRIQSGEGDIFQEKLLAQSQAIETLTQSVENHPLNIKVNTQGLDDAIVKENEMQQEMDETATKAQATESVISGAFGSASVRNTLANPSQYPKEVIPATTNTQLPVGSVTSLYTSSPQGQVNIPANFTVANLQNIVSQFSETTVPINFTPKNLEELINILSNITIPISLTIKDIDGLNPDSSDFVYGFAESIAKLKDSLERIDTPKLRDLSTALIGITSNNVGVRFASAIQDVSDALTNLNNSVENTSTNTAEFLNNLKSLINDGSNLKEISDVINGSASKISGNPVPSNTKNSDVSDIEKANNLFKKEIALTQDIWNLRAKIASLDEKDKTNAAPRLNFYNQLKESALELRNVLDDINKQDLDLLTRVISENNYDEKYRLVDQNGRRDVSNARASVYKKRQQENDSRRAEEERKASKEKEKRDKGITNYERRINNLKELHGETEEYIKSVEKLNSIKAFDKDKKEFLLNGKDYQDAKKNLDELLHTMEEASSKVKNQALSNITSNLKQLLSFDKTSSKAGIGGLIDSFSDGLNNPAFNNLEADLATLGIKLEDYDNDVYKAINSNKELQKSFSSLSIKTVDSMISEVNSQITLLSNKGSKNGFTAEGTNMLNELNTFKNNLLQIKQEISTNGIVDSKGFENFSKGVIDADTSLTQFRKNLQDIDNLVSANSVSLSKFQNKLAKWAQGNSRAMNMKEYSEQFKQIEQAANSAGGVTEARLKELVGDFNSLDKEVRDAGVSGLSFFDQWSQRLQSLKSYFMTFFSAFAIINRVKEAIGTVKELDSAFVEMRKVSNDSLESLEKFANISFNLGDTVGTTGLQMQKSAADFMRIGEDINQATESALNANKLLNVSEFENIDDATESLIAMKAAYNDLTEGEIIDKLNEVGNNYAISTNQLAEGLQKAAATLKTQGNDINEAIALITAGNTTIQDAASVAAGVKVVSLRIAGTKEAEEELKAAGEDTEDYVVMTASKKRQIIKDYTAVASNGGQGIDIYDENGNYKSTYEILKEISEVYKEIQEEDKKFGTNRAAGLIEELAGKNRSNIVAAILNNGEVLNKAYLSSLEEAEGSAQDELDKYLDSIEGKQTQIQNKGQQISSDVFNVETIKTALDLANNFLTVVTQITDLLGSWSILIPVAAFEAFREYKQPGSSLFTSISNGLAKGNNFFKSSVETDNSTAIYDASKAVSAASIDAETVALEANTAAKAANATAGEASVALTEEEIAARATESVQLIVAAGAEQGYTATKIEELATTEGVITSEGALCIARLEEIAAGEGEVANLAALVLAKQKEIEANNALNASNKQAANSVGLIGKALNWVKANPFTAMLIALAGVVAVAHKIHKEFYDLDNLIEKSSKAFSDYETAQSNLDDLNTKLQETQDRITELDGMDSLTITEQEELDRLRLENEELERQKAILQEIADAKQTESETATLAALSAMTGNYVNAQWDKDTLPNVTRSAIDEIVKLQKDRAKQLESYNHPKSDEEKFKADNEIKAIDAELESYEKQLDKDIPKLEELRQRLSKAETAEGKAKYKELTDLMDDYINRNKSELQVASENFDKFISSEGKGVEELREKLALGAKEGKSLDEVLRSLGISIWNIPTASLSVMSEYFENLKSGAAGVVDEIEVLSLNIDELATDEESAIARIEKAFGEDASEKGDTYASMLERIKTAKELVESGDIGTEKFKSIASFFSPTGADDLDDWKENLSKINKYFTEDSKGVYKFMDDLTKALNDMGYKEAEIKDGFYNLPDYFDAEKVGKKLGIGGEAVVTLMGEAMDKGLSQDFFTDSESGFNTLIGLENELADAQLELNKLESDKSTSKTRLDAQKEKIEDLKIRINQCTDSLDTMFKKFETGDGKQDKGASTAEKKLIGQYAQRYNQLNERKWATESERKQWESQRGQLGQTVIQAAAEKGVKLEYNKRGQLVRNKKKSDEILDKYAEAIRNKDWDYIDSEAKKRGIKGSKKEARKEFKRRYGEENWLTEEQIQQLNQTDTQNNTEAVGENTNSMGENTSAINTLTGAIDGLTEALGYDPKLKEPKEKINETPEESIDSVINEKIERHRRNTSTTTKKEPKEKKEKEEKDSKSKGKKKASAFENFFTGNDGSVNAGEVPEEYAESISKVEDALKSEDSAAQKSLATIGRYTEEQLKSADLTGQSSDQMSKDFMSLMDSLDLSYDSADKLIEVLSGMGLLKVEPQIDLSGIDSVDQLNEKISGELESGQSVTYSAHVEGVDGDTQIKALENVDGTITYTAKDLDGVEKEVEPVANQDGTITYHFTTDGEKDLTKDGKKDKDGGTVTTKTDMDTKGFEKGQKEVQQGVQTLSGEKATPQVNLEGATYASNQMRNLINEADRLNGKKSTMTIETIRREVIEKKYNNTHKPEGGNTKHKQFNGTFHTSNAYASGTNVSLQKNETALINELGEEIVVRDGKAMTFNNGYPTFAKLKRGDIIFNHKQSQELEENGYVTGSHAKIYGGESAFASGTVIGNAYARGPVRTTTAKKSSKPNSDTDSGGGKGGGGGKGKGKGKGKKKSSGDKKWDQFEKWLDKFFDWIEIRLDALSTKTEKWTSYFEKFLNASSTNAQKAYTAAMNAAKTEQNQSGTASDRYLQQALKVGYKGADKAGKKVTRAWVDSMYQRILDGSLDDKAIQKLSEKRKGIIEAMQGYIDKAKDAANTTEELTDSINDLIKAQRDAKVEFRNNQYSAAVEGNNGYTASTKNSGLTSSSMAAQYSIDAYNNAVNQGQAYLGQLGSTAISASNTKDATNKKILKTLKGNNKKGYTNNLSAATSAIKGGKAISESVINYFRKMNPTLAAKYTAWNTQLVNQQNARIEDADNFGKSMETIIGNVQQSYANIDEDTERAISLAQSQADNQSDYREANKVLDKLYQYQADIIANDEAEIRTYSNMRTSYANGVKSASYGGTNVGSLDTASQNVVTNLRNQIVGIVSDGKMIPDTTMETLYSYYSQGYISATFYEACRAYNMAFARGEEAQDQLRIDKEAQKQANRENFSSQISNIQTNYDNQVSKVEALKNSIAGSYDDSVTQGNTIKLRVKEYEELQIAFQKALDTGVIEKGSKEWYEYAIKIQEAKNEVNELKQTQFETVLAEKFDRAIEKAQEFIDKLETINGLITDEMLYNKDSGQLTSYGLMSLGLNSQSMASEQNNLEKYFAKRQEIIDEYAKGNTSYFGDQSFDEMITQNAKDILDSISSINSYRESIINLIEGMRDAELEALQKVIDKRKEALQKKKE